MAINPETQYPGKITPSTPEYPYGSARNITVPGDGTGTPWEAALVNDLLGWQQALLGAASIVPSGNPDKVGESQYLNALLKMITDNAGAVFATVADMVAGGAVGGGSFDLQAGQTATVLGAIQRGDGGYAHYVIEDSGGEVALDNGRTAKKQRPLEDYVFDVVICYGQSNTVGFAGQPGVPAVDDVATPTPGPWSRAYDPVTDSIVEISNTMAHLNYVDEGTDSRGNAWTAFANKWQKETGRGIVIINAGRGGKSIAELSKGSGSGATNYYQVLLDGYTSTVNAMAAQNLPLGNVYAVWHQGETDQTLGTNSVDYRNALNLMAQNLIADIGPLEKFGVFIVGCPDSRPQETWERIQSAQWGAARYGAGAGFTNSMAVISDVCPSFTEANGQYNPADGTHYSQRGYNQMGESGAEGLARWVTSGSTFSASKEDTKHRNINGNGRGNIQLVQGMASWNATTWLLLRDSNTGNTIHPCHVQRIDQTTDGIRFVMSGKKPVTLGLSAEVNEPGLISKLTPIVEAWNNGSDEWGFEVKFVIDLDFYVAKDTGELFDGYPPQVAASDSLLKSIVSATSLGANSVQLTHPPIVFPPMLTYYASASQETAEVSMRAIDNSNTRVSNTGANTVTAVSMKRVPIERVDLEAFGQLTIRLSAFVSDDL